MVAFGGGGSKVAHILTWSFLPTSGRSGRVAAAALSLPPDDEAKPAKPAKRRRGEGGGSGKGKRAKKR